MLHVNIINIDINPFCMIIFIILYHIFSLNDFRKWGTCTVRNMKVDKLGEKDTLRGNLKTPGSSFDVKSLIYLCKNLGTYFLFPTHLENLWIVEVSSHQEIFAFQLECMALLEESLDSSTPPYVSVCLVDLYFSYFLFFFSDTPYIVLINTNIKTSLKNLQ